MVRTAVPSLWASGEALAVPATNSPEAPASLVALVVLPYKSESRTVLYLAVHSAAVALAILGEGSELRRGLRVVFGTDSS